MKSLNIGHVRRILYQLKNIYNKSQLDKDIDGKVINR